MGHSPMIPKVFANSLKEDGMKWESRMYPPHPKRAVPQTTSRRSIIPVTR